MVTRIYIVFICFIFSSQLLLAQDAGTTLQAEDPSYLPASSVNIKKSPGSTPKSEVINAIEQSGLYPYKGHACEDVSMSFEVGDNNKTYGSNEYCSINLRIVQYGSQAKEIFNQLKPYDITLRELQGFASSSKTEPDPNGSRKSRTVNEADVTNGKMVLVIDVIECVESHYKEYTVIHYRSAALVGTTIITIMGTYYYEEEALAKKIHSEIIENINKGFR